MTTADELARFAAAIEQRLGLRIEPDRATAMIELIDRRAAAHREPPAAYLDRLARDAAELRTIAGELTIGETYFFRHVEQFHAFAEVVLPERLAARDRVNVLSAGCSSGEEPLTLAMLVRERGADAARVRIHAIDVNPLALARAATGRYSRWALRATPPELEARWFETHGRDHVLSPMIRNAVTFEERNLIVADPELWAPERWDVVFCRNAIMYFTVARIQEVIARITRSLARGGYLFLGHAETLRGLSDDFELCHTHGTFYYQRKPATQGGVRDARAMAPTSPTDAAAPSTTWFADIQAATERIHAMVDGALPAAPAPAPAAAPSREPVLDEIRALIGDERFAEALAALAALPPARAADRDALLLRAIVLAHTGRMVDAEAASRDVLRGGELAEARYVLALCLESAADPAGAAREAQRAIALDPSFAMARLHLGLLARRAADRPTAARELARAIELLDRDADDRLQLYGGGFGRHALIELCRAELAKVNA